MKKKLLAGLATGLFIFSLAGTANAAQSLINAGFETGDLTGWTIGGNSVDYGVNTDGVDISTYTLDSFDPTCQNIRSGSYGAYGIVELNR